MPERPVASVSLDMDNLWSYLKTHGDPEWERWPSYLPVLLPRMLDVFAGHARNATVFVVGADAARDDGAEAVRALAAAGHEIANHSFRHEPWLHRYPREELVSELERTEAAIVEAGAPRPAGFRGPGYSVSPDLLDVLVERGYAYDASILPTWIGPLARWYYFRSSGMDGAQRTERAALFGSARDGLLPVHPFRWEPGGLVEIPVTTMPLARVPVHVSYLVHLHASAPKAAKAYFRAALAMCRLRGVGPSLLLHPLDLLDGKDAPALGFFPGMAVPAVEKRALLAWALDRIAERFTVVGVGEHARRQVAAGVARTRSRSSAGPRTADREG